MRLSSLGLSSRLLSLILFAVVPSALVSLALAARERGVEAAAAKQDALRLARLAAINEEQLIGGAHQLLVALARVPQVRSGDGPGCSAFMANLAPDFPQYFSLGAIRGNGDVYCTSFRGARAVNVAETEFFKRTIATRDFFVGEHMLEPVSGRPTLMFAQPVLDDSGALRSIVVAALDLGWLARVGPRVALSPGSSLLVVDNVGTILTRHPDPEKWSGRGLPEEPLVQAILEGRGEGTTETRGLDGVPRLFAFTRVATGRPGAHLYVAVGIPTAEVARDVRRQLLRNLMIVALMAALAVGVAWLGARRLVLEPVRSLIGTTQRLTQGDLSSRSGLVNAVGDLAVLARAYDEMALSIGAHQRALEVARDDLARSLERFELFTDGVKGYALVMLDQDGRVATWNAGAQRLFELPSRAALGTHFSELLTENARELGLPAEMMEAVRNDPVVEFECAVQRGSVGVFWASVQLNALRDAAGRLHGYAFLLRDLTEVKQAENERRSLARRLLSAQEDERRRVARELHDEIGQLLTALKLTLQAIPYLPPAEIEGRVQAGLAAVDRAIAEVRTLSLALRPLVLDDLGLAAAVRWHVDRRCRDAGLEGHVRVDLPDGRMPPDIETTAYRVVQEAVTNVLRHAQARNVWASAERVGDSLVLSVRDDGRGFYSSTVAERRGSSMGLSSMRERVSLVGGEIEIESAPDRGTEVRAVLPLGFVPELAEDAAKGSTT